MGLTRASIEDPELLTVAAIDPGKPEVRPHPIYIYMYMYICVYVYMYRCIYRTRGRGHKKAPPHRIPTSTLKMSLPSQRLTASHLEGRWCMLGLGVCYFKANSNTSNSTIRSKGARLLNAAPGLGIPVLCGTCLWNPASCCIHHQGSDPISTRNGTWNFKTTRNPRFQPRVMKKTPCVSCSR